MDIPNFTPKVAFECFCNDIFGKRELLHNVVCHVVTKLRYAKQDLPMLASSRVMERLPVRQTRRGLLCVLMCFDVFLVYFGRHTGSEGSLFARREENV